MGESCKIMGQKSEAKASDVDDHIINRYEMKKRLGKGAYGIVWKAIDRKSKDVVAVKKIFDAFRNQTDAQRTFREIMFLQAFKEHPNIIRLRGLHRANNNRDIYLVFDYMDSDLHHVIKRGTLLTDVHKRYIMYQAFRATQYLHSGNVIHRDLKPSNVLINAECKVKIADFGLARSLAHSQDEGDDGILTDYVATRWYRAPEILVASKRYTKGVDMWSLGCILGEMLLGKPLFPGSSTVNQMERIMAVLPEPTPQEIQNMCSGCGKGLLEGFSGLKTSLRELVKNPEQEPFDLLEKLLVFDPTNRITAAEGLKHPYVNQYCRGGELILDRDVTPPLDDDIQLSVSEYRNKLYEMITYAQIKKRDKKERQLMNGNSPESKNDYQKPLERGNKSLEAVTKVRNSMEPKSSQMETIRRLQKYQKLSSAEDIHNARYKDKNSRDLIREVKERRDVRDFKEYKDRAAKLMASRSEGNQIDPSRRHIASPSEKLSGTPPARVTAGWPDRQKALCNKTVATTPSYKNRLDEMGDCGGGDGPTLQSSQVQPHFRSALAQVKEKLRLAQAMSSLSTLPKVSQKRENHHQNSCSPSHVSRYNSRHAILTSSELQEIRAILKNQ